MITLNPKAYEDGREYAEALIEACAPSGTDPVLVLSDTESHRRIVKGVEMAEFLVGWFHGSATVLGVTLRELWGHLSAGLETPGAKGKRKASPARKAIGATTIIGPDPEPAVMPKIFAAPGTEPRALPPPLTAAQQRGIQAARRGPGPTPIQRAQHAAARLGADATAAIVGPGGLSGCSAAALVRLVSEANKAPPPAPGSPAALREYMVHPAEKPPAKRGKAAKPPKEPKATKPPKSTRASRRRAAQPELGL